VIWGLESQAVLFVQCLSQEKNTINKNLNMAASSTDRRWPRN